MSHKKSQNKSAKNGALAGLQSELALPRMARSAKIAELHRDTTRIPERPSISMSGTVERIIPERNQSHPEKADISIAEAHQSSHFRIENTLTDEHGDEIRLKTGAHVDVTVTDESTPPKRSS
jgi:hypothetical protein